MSSLSFVRELVKELMEADADEEEHLKRKLKMRKILKTRKYPDADGEEHRGRATIRACHRAAPEFLATGRQC